MKKFTKNTKNPLPSTYFSGIIMIAKNINFITKYKETKSENQGFIKYNKVFIILKK